VQVLLDGPRDDALAKAIEEGRKTASALRKIDLAE